MIFLEKMMTQLSAAAVEFRRHVEDEALFLQTCEGGDPGSPDQPSIWVLGIEPGWSLADAAADEKADPDREAQVEAYSIEQQLTWRYNCKAFQLLAEMNGVPLADYVQFAHEARPFERGSKGYFKANLFPEPFNNVGEWDAAATGATGFNSKADYRNWLRSARFNVLKKWIQKCHPKVVIGTGLTHLHDFMAITGTNEEPAAHRFEVNGHSKRMHVSTAGIVPMAVVPHFTGGSHGLNSDESVRVAAQTIRTALAA